MTVSETPGRTIGPGLLLDESANNGMFPPEAVLVCRDGHLLPFAEHRVERRCDRCRGSRCWLGWWNGCWGCRGRRREVAGDRGLKPVIWTGSGLRCGRRWRHGRLGRRLRFHGHRWWSAFAQVGAQPLFQHLRFHSGDIGDAADKSQEKYPEDRASPPPDFLCGFSGPRAFVVIV